MLPLLNNALKPKEMITMAGFSESPRTRGLKKARNDQKQAKKTAA